MRQETLQGRDDERDVRLLALPERGGDADDEGIRLPDLIELRGGEQPALRDQRRQRFGGDIAQIGLPAVEPGHALQIDVNATHGEAGLGELHGEREPHVAQPDHLDPSRLGRDLALEKLLPRAHSETPFGRFTAQAL